MSSTVKKGVLKSGKGPTSNQSSSSNIKSKTGKPARSGAGGAQSSRRSGMSASQVGDGKANHSMIVRDPDNPERDVTPLSLLDIGEPSALQVQGAGSITPRSRGSDRGDSSAGYSGVSKSGWGSSGASTPTRTDDEDGGMEGDEAEVRVVKVPSLPQVTMLQDEFPTKLADIKREKDKQIKVVLSETETFFMLDIPSSCVADDDEKLKKVMADNAEYTAFVKQKAGQDKYSDRAMQTLNTASKNKDAQATPAPTASIGVEATNYEIHDAIEALKAGEDMQEDDMKGSSNKSSGDTKGLAWLTGKAQAGDLTKGIFDSDKFKHALMAAERIVIQNLYHEKQRAYREPGPADPESKGRGAKLEELFTFSCPLTKDRTVTCMSWNKLNPDLLAVGYGEFEFSKQTDGMVLFWSLKNPEFPQKVYHMECSVTSVAFANKSPNLLAVGLYDGTVGVYDVRKPEDKRVLESSFTSGKHSDAVWEVVWVDKGTERAEALVSVSSDGRVTQWTMSKGLENSDLIKLKRVASHKKPPAAGTGGGAPSSSAKEAFISRMASGMCAAFHPTDPSFYIVGTEEGSVHKCSVSYNEQVRFLRSHVYPHMGQHIGPYVGVSTHNNSTQVFCVLQ